MTAGLTGRIRMPSLESMRAGCVRCPHALVSLFLAAGRRAGLPRAWAEQLLAWTQGEVERLWADRQLSLVDARRREARAECVGNQVQLETIQTGQSIEDLRSELAATLAETAEERALAAALAAEIAKRERSEVTS